MVSGQSNLDTVSILKVTDLNWEKTCGQLRVWSVMGWMS